MIVGEVDSILEETDWVMALIARRIVRYCSLDCQVSRSRLSNLHYNVFLSTSTLLTYRPVSRLCRTIPEKFIDVHVIEVFVGIPHQCGSSTFEVCKR